MALFSEAFDLHTLARPARWLISCDHASNHVPDWVNGGDLGLPAADMARHIAYDPGAAGVTLALAESLEAPAILSRFSRLVIDPNRGEDDPTLVMKLYDGSVIPANRAADAQEIERRLERLHRPYHAALETVAAAHPQRVLCAIHSFTPCLRGRPPRPWHIGVLYSPLDSRLAEALFDVLKGESDLVVGDNQPYNGHLEGDSIYRHALAQGRPNVMIELRNDLIATPESQKAWGRRLAPLLTAALTRSGL